MKTRAQIAVFGGILALAGLLSLGGCSDDGANDAQRLVCDVMTVNAGNPLVSAYVNAGSDQTVGTDDDYQPIDTVQVIFHARPYGSTVFVPEDGAYSWFEITRYDLRWETPAGAPDLSGQGVTGGVAYAMVPAYEEGAVSVLIAGMDFKSAQWFIDLYNEAIPSFQATARLTFYGHESGSDEEVAIETGLQVNFIGVVIDG